ncbi:hypothetical protein R3P38DRAFT_3252746 [Favolaschia claudopus]|uniref:Uncharacterized protein n=1 Tax=Favolaschia claudopus TaxID=2862362 RepID=A0AAW0E0H6_9AGAR
MSSIAKRILALTVFVSLLAVFSPVPGSPPNGILASSTPPSGVNSTSPECLNPPPDSCTFYADCLESRYQCGSSGYPLGYGQKFCTKFQTQRASLSEKGQAWMLATLHCLQEALVPDASGAPHADGSCAALKKTAFDSHAPCYVSNGLCTLNPSDWIAIVEIVGIETLFDSWDAFKATLTAGTDCLEFYAYLLEQKL